MTAAVSGWQAGAGLKHSAGTQQLWIVQFGKGLEHWVRCVSRGQDRGRIGW